MKTLLFTLLLSTSLHAVVPQSVIDLGKVTDKNSEAYLFGATYAAVDAKQAAISALEGGDSAEALRILTAALQVMPHMDELRSLRNKALETVISITKALEENPEKNCVFLMERYNFLSVTAPDTMTQLKNDKSCIGELKPVERDLFKIPSLAVIPELEKQHKVNLAQTAEEIIKRNTNFPYDDVLNNSMSYLFEVYNNDYVIECRNFVLDPNLTNSESINLKGTCAPRGSYVITPEATGHYCEYLRQLLAMDNGTQEISCGTRRFNTSDPIFQNYAGALANSSFSSGLPRYAIMKMLFRYKTHTRTVPLLVSIQAGQSPIPEIEFLRSEKEYFQKLTGEVEFKNLSTSDLKDLVEISFIFDFRSTYQFHKLFFAEAAAKEKGCLELRARHTRSQPRDELCPRDGHLSQLMLNHWRKYIVDEELKNSLTP